MKCPDCKNYDIKQEECSLLTDEIEDTVCLMRHIKWAIEFNSGLLQDMLIILEEDDEGDNWKKT